MFDRQPIRTTGFNMLLVAPYGIVGFDDQNAPESAIVYFSGENMLMYEKLHKYIRFTCLMTVSGWALKEEDFNSLFDERMQTLLLVDD